MLQILKCSYIVQFLVSFNRIRIVPLHPLPHITPRVNKITLMQGAAYAGFPSPASDDLESVVDPIDWVVRNPSSTFWWRVEGNCLWDAGIRNGDLIAVDRAGKKRIGRTVLAVVDGEVVAKILDRIDGKYFLTTANAAETYQNIQINEDTVIWGVIAGVVRRCDLE